MIQYNRNCEYCTKYWNYCMKLYIILALGKCIVIFVYPMVRIGYTLFNNRVKSACCLGEDSENFVSPFLFYRKRYVSNQLIIKAHLSIVNEMNMNCGNGRIRTFKQLHLAHCLCLNNGTIFAIPTMLTSDKLVGDIRLCVTFKIRLV